jgi:hypothetical protein
MLGEADCTTCALRAGLLTDATSNETQFSLTNAGDIWSFAATVAHSAIVTF